MGWRINYRIKCADGSTLKEGGVCSGTGEVIAGDMSQPLNGSVILFDPATGASASAWLYGEAADIEIINVETGPDIGY